MKRTIILYCVVLASLACVFNSYAETAAYFGNEQSISCTIIAPAQGADANQITVTGDGKLTGNGEKLHDIDVRNDFENATIIDEMQIWLNTSEGSTVRVTKITFGGHDFFTGSMLAGGVIDGKDFTLNGGETAKLEVYFSEDVSQMSPITITFGMFDGSTKTATFDPKYKAENGNNGTGNKPGDRFGR